MFERLRARVAHWLQPSSEQTISRRIKRIEEGLHTLTEQHDDVARQLRQLHAGIDGLVRAAYIDPTSLSYPERLTARRFRLLSQNQEDGVLLTLFQQIGTTSRRFVEIGSGATGGNAAMLAGEFGWTGLLVEGDCGKVEYARRRFPRTTAVCAWVTPESVNQILEQHG